MQIIIEYISNNYLEVTAAVFGLIYVTLAARQNYLCWLAGIVNVLIFAWIFFNNRLYANTALQIIYFIISLYGYYCWITKKPGLSAKISFMDNSYRMLMVVFIVIITVFAYLSLAQTNSTTLFADAITAAAGLIATWMQARKFIENWIIWIPTNIVLAILFFSKNLYVASALFAIYTIIAIFAFFNWKKMYRQSLLNKA